tara:strand:+ start:21 stop:248 length:228 start_codon:yes stop_codon:yes gene_type:complete
MDKERINEFITSLSEAIDSEGIITAETQLNDIDWDSLAMISTIAIADEKFNKILDPDLLGKCKDINEIVRLIDNS